MGPILWNGGEWNGGGKGLIDPHLRDGSRDHEERCNQDLRAAQERENALIRQSLRPIVAEGGRKQDCACDTVPFGIAFVGLQHRDDGVPISLEVLPIIRSIGISQPTIVPAFPIPALKAAQDYQPEGGAEHGQDQMGKKLEEEV
jgi:hypothetical protein